MANHTIANYISDIYAKHYDAKIAVHYPMLFSIMNQQGEVLGAVGFRPAVDGDLFLEQYLDTPIEHKIKVPRQNIVEVGSLASNNKGATMLLFTALSAYLDDQGFTHAVVTGTRMLEKRLKLMGLAPQRLASANPELLLHNDECWGSYYDTQPQVLLGSVTAGNYRLKQILQAEYYPLSSAELSVELPVKQCV
jgi:hypothetical protein